MATTAAVLAVDDNATVRKAVSLRLGARGFEVVTAADGESALALAATRRFDVVLLDLQMPGMRGDEVLRRLRGRYPASELPVIMLAASSDAADIDQTLELGANDYIIKPGDLPLLVARIRTQLALRDTVRRLRTSAGRRAATGATVIPLRQASAADAQELPFDLLHDLTPMACFTLTPEGSILHANRLGAELHGFGVAELLGRPLLDLYPPDERPHAQEQLAAVLDLPGRVHRWDIRHRKQDGEILWMRDTARAVRQGARNLVLLSCDDIDDDYRMHERLRFQARHDELTGLANRAALEERLRQVIDSAQSEQTEHAVLLIDLDRFKLVNDACGHAGGDELLRQVARALRPLARRRDVLARTGTDTFALLLEDAGAALAATAGELVRRAIDAHDFCWGGQRHPLTASIGVVPIGEHSGETPAQLLNLADLACAAAKESGRNCVHVYQPDHPPLVAQQGEMRWAGRITQALEQDRLSLWFQPIRPLAADRGGAQHIEILLRMADARGELVMPGEFLPAAERFQLAARLDRWVVTRVFDWLEAHPAMLDRIAMCAINLSAQSIGIAAMHEFIRAHVTRRRVPPHKLCFEITETAAIGDLVQATRFMQQLRALGCRFALDDFGAGFSSLTYLKQLPVDFLKIDGAFVRELAHNSVDQAMVRSIHEIGRVLGKQTIAEFVEDEPTLDWLRRLGVDFAQGYGVGRPAPLEFMQA